MCNKQDLVTNVMDLSEAEARKDNPNIPKSSKAEWTAHTHIAADWDLI